MPSCSDTVSTSFASRDDHAGPAEETGGDDPGGPGRRLPPRLAQLQRPAVALRASEAAGAASNGTLMAAHRDCTVLSMVMQHDAKALEVQAKEDGSWLAVAPEPDTVAVIAGELLAVSACAAGARRRACTASARWAVASVCRRSLCPSPRTARRCGRSTSSSAATARRSTSPATSTGRSTSGSPGMGAS